MLKRLLLAVGLSLWAGSAFAVCTGPIVLKDNNGATFNMSVVQGADGNCQYKVDWDTSSQAHTDATAVGNVNLYQGGAAQSATNGGFFNMLQGNAALSSSNPAFHQSVAGTSGAATPSFIVAANTNNSTNLKASAGIVYGIQVSNINSTTAYFIKLYDKATAPTCGTDTPVAGYVIPPTNGGNNVVLPVGKQFSTGIGYCIVAGIANSDNTAVPAATILANIDWK